MTMSIRTAFWSYLSGAVVSITLGTALFRPQHGIAAGALILRGLMLLVAGTFWIVMYYVVVRGRIKTELASVTETAVDSVYYLGFLVTLTTLISTVISYGVFDLGNADNAATSVIFIAVSFGLSLLATGLALAFRIDLINQRDAVGAAPEPTDLIHDRIIELEDAYRQLSTVMNEASARFSQGLDGANASLTDHAAATGRTLSELSAGFHTTMAADKAAFVERMTSIIEDARTNLREFVKAASLEAATSGLAVAAAGVTDSLVTSGKSLTAFLKRLEALDGRAEAALHNVDSLGASVQRASVSALEMSQALSKASNGATTIDVEPVRAALAQLAQTVHRVDSATTGAESSYVDAVDRASSSIRTKADDMTTATARLSAAFVSLSDELARSAGFFASHLK